MYAGYLYSYGQGASFTYGYLPAKIDSCEGKLDTKFSLTRLAITLQAWFGVNLTFVRSPNHLPDFADPWIDRVRPSLSDNRMLCRDLKTKRLFRERIKVQNRLSVYSDKDDGSLSDTDRRRKQELKSRILSLDWQGNLVRRLRPAETLHGQLLWDFFQFKAFARYPVDDDSLDFFLTDAWLELWGIPDRRKELIDVWQRGLAYAPALWYLGRTEALDDWYFNNGDRAKQIVMDWLMSSSCLRSRPPGFGPSCDAVGNVIEYSSEPGLELSSVDRGGTRQRGEILSAYMPSWDLTKVQTEPAAASDLEKLARLREEFVGQLPSDPNDEPLSLKLKRRYYTAFRLGRKCVQYRKCSTWFHLENCCAGRRVLLICGSRSPLTGVITSSSLDHYAFPTGDIAQVYGSDPIDVIAMQILLDPECLPAQPDLLRPTETSGDSVACGGRGVEVRRFDRDHSRRGGRILLATDLATMTGHSVGYWAQLFSSSKQAPPMGVSLLRQLDLLSQMEGLVDLPFDQLDPLPFM